MAAKFRKYSVSFICVVLCWALVIAPCFFAARVSFASDGEVNDAAYVTAVAVVPADMFSLPPVLTEIAATDNGVDNIQDLATSDKVLAGLESEANGQQAPSKPAAQVTRPQPTPSPVQPSIGVTPAAPDVKEEGDLTYKLLTQPNGKSFIYYEQTWDAYKNHPYGYNTVGSHGCGPTSMSMVISNLTGVTVSPKYMADWSYKNGFYVRGRGTAYGLFPAASAAFGLKCSTISCYDKQAVVSALQSGKLLITVVRAGDFTNGRHFLLIRGITADGKLLLADSGKYANCLTEWDYTRVLSQVANGSFWVFEK